MDTSSQSARRRWPIIVGIIAVLIVAAVVWLLIARPWATELAPVPPSPSATPTSIPTPLISASGAPSTPTPAPVESDSPIAPELAPVELTQPAVGSDGATLSLALIEAVQGEGVAPGETSGPAIRVTLRIENTTDEALDANLVAVNAYVGEDRVPAPGLTQPGGQPFEGSIAPGEAAEGVYLFTVDADSRSDVFIGVDYRAGQPTVIFRGELD